MNKVKISKHLEDVLYDHKIDGDTPSLTHTLFGFRTGLIKLDENSRFYEVFNLFNKYHHEDVLKVLAGDYEVEYTKEEKVEEKYKENKKICYDTYDEKELILYKGFNKGIEFVNEVYGLKIKFSEEKGNE